MDCVNGTPPDEESSGGNDITAVKNIKSRDRLGLDGGAAAAEAQVREISCNKTSRSGLIMTGRLRPASVMTLGPAKCIIFSTN